MNTGQSQSLDHLVSTQRGFGQDWITYWQQYSSLNSWGFWVNVLFLIVPLVVLYLTLDRTRAFQIGFYGFNVHVWFNYIDALGATRGLWTYPFRVMPFLPISFSLEVSFIPVVYMLVYQWVLNRKKNYYLYATVTSAVIAFVIKPVMSLFGLFQLYEWMNYFYLFAGYIVIMLVSKWVTDFFEYLQGSRRGVNKPSGESFTGGKESNSSRWRRRTPI